LQLPQFRVPPQPSLTLPQLAPAAAHVTGVQPHWFGVPPPPHDSGALHEPQLRAFPQPSETVPQSAPSSAQVFGVHGPTPH
jgi:hypothetical protein